MDAHHEDEQVKTCHDGSRARDRIRGFEMLVATTMHGNKRFVPLALQLNKARGAERSVTH